MVLTRKSEVAVGDQGVMEYCSCETLLITEMTALIHL